jgi:hypothetical protein
MPFQKTGLVQIFRLLLLTADCLRQRRSNGWCRAHSASPHTPVAYKGGLPGYRLKRVLDHIGDNLAKDLSLTQLAAVAGMSPPHAEAGKSLLARRPIHLGSISDDGRRIHHA